MYLERFFKKTQMINIINSSHADNIIEKANVIKHIVATVWVAEKVISNH